MQSELSFLRLVLDASPLVQFVMLTLMVASVLSWTIIFDRSRIVKKAGKMADDFEDKFWSGVDLADLYRGVDRDRENMAGMSAIFHAGFREYARLRENRQVEPMAVVEGAHRAMRVALSREMDHLEHHLSFLATIGSTSPYIGLFGTVWGIMNAFLNIAAQQDTSLGTVAGPIAEALFATGMGLIAAIPAVIFYNKFTGDLTRFADQLDAFSQDVLVRLSRRASDPGRD